MAQTKASALGLVRLHFVAKTDPIVTPVNPPRQVTTPKIKLILKIVNFKLLHLIYKKISRTGF